MKNLIWGLVALVIAGGIVLEFRYDVRIDSPVVAKLDRFTGDTWIANAGVWKKVQHTEEDIQGARAAKPGEAATPAK
jgi:hypothetical protein